MWRNPAAMPPSLIFILLIVFAAANGVIHTEGGSYVKEGDPPSNYEGDNRYYGESIPDEQQWQGYNAPPAFYNEEQELYPVPREFQQHDEPNNEEIEKLQSFGRIFHDLQEADAGRERQIAQGAPQYRVQPVDEEEEEFGVDDREWGHPQQRGSTAAGPARASGKQAAKKESTAAAEDKVEKAAKSPAVVKQPIPVVKKGEPEYEAYVGPAYTEVASNRQKSSEYLEKRIAESSSSEEHMLRDDERVLGLISTSGNILFIAFITMCCALTVVGVVGGTYYYRHVRYEREDLFDDFTRYSPAGPGKQRGLVPGFTSEKGDEALAYRAQLHHYQQTKQKIIGAGDDTFGSQRGGPRSGMGMDEGDTDKSEDEGELEHNYSVYECPGLAPTGDIEVQNPNFVDNTGVMGAGKHSPSSPSAPPMPR